MRRLSIIDLAGGDQPISQRGRDRPRRPERRDLQLPRAARASSSSADIASRRASDTEVLVHLYEERGPAFVHALRGHVRARALGRARAARSCSRATASGSSRSTTAAAGGVLSFASELKALPQPGPARSTWTRSQAFLAFNSIPAPLLDLPRRAQAPGRPPARLGGGRRAARRALRAPGAGAPARACGRSARRARRGAARRACATRCAPTWSPTCRSACSSPAASTPARSQRSPRGDRRAACSTFSIGFEERSFDELERARLRGPRATAPITTSSCCGPTPSSSCRARRRPSTSPSPTRRPSRRTSSRALAARARQGRALGRGRRRALRRLPHLRRRPARAARRPARPPRSGPSSSSCRARRRKASFDYKAKRFVRAAHLPPLERHHGWKEIFSPDARAELLGRRRAAARPARRLPRSLRARPTGAEQLARLQDVDLGVYLADDLLVKTDRASMAHSLEARVPLLDPVVADFALALPTRHKVRGLREEAPASQGGRAAAPSEIVHGRKRGFSIPPAAWLRGELEPLRARRALARPDSSTGVPPSGGRDARPMSVMTSSPFVRCSLVGAGLVGSTTSPSSRWSPRRGPSSGGTGP